jgi:hypothetical protein
MAKYTPRTNYEKMPVNRNPSISGLSRGLKYARQLGATHCIITSKADPLQDWSYVQDIAFQASEYGFLVDLHTNGYLLVRSMIDEFLGHVDQVTFHTESFDKDVNREIMGIQPPDEEVVRCIVKLGKLVRFTALANKKTLPDVRAVIDYVKRAGALGAQRVAIRELGTYNKWCEDNWVDVVDMFFKMAALTNPHTTGNALYRRGAGLPTGENVFLFDDPPVQLTLGSGCFGEADDFTIRSIVHRPDGHGYRSWFDVSNILY